MGTDMLAATVSGVVWLVLLCAATAALANRKLRQRHVPGALTLVAFAVVYPIGVGFGIAGATTRATSTFASVNVTVGQLAAISILPLIVLVIARRFRPVVTALVLVYAFALLLEFFTGLYWTYGTSRNFSVPLSRLDALYFALGTLTTGTGNIAAISETSRRIQTIQMGIDFLFIGLLVAFAIARYSTLFDRSHRGLPPGGATAAEPAPRSDGSEQSPDASVARHSR
jgi:hypothetical protein